MPWVTTNSDIISGPLWTQCDSACWLSKHGPNHNLRSSCVTDASL